MTRQCDLHHLDSIATRKRPHSGTFEAMREHVRSVWPDAKYNNSSGFWSLGSAMVAECWPHQTEFLLWRWRVATVESGGLETGWRS